MPFGATCRGRKQPIREDGSHPKRNSGCDAARYSVLTASLQRRLATRLWTTFRKNRPAQRLYIVSGDLSGASGGRMGRVLSYPGYMHAHVCQGVARGERDGSRLRLDSTAVDSTRRHAKRADSRAAEFQGARAPLCDRRSCTGVDGRASLWALHTLTPCWVRYASPSERGANAPTLGTAVEVHAHTSRLLRASLPSGRAR